MIKQGQMFDLKDGPPKLAEEQVPAYQQLVDYMCKTPEHKAAAQAALDARDAQKLQAILGGRKDAY